jgi:hypothetical protein
MPRQKLIVNVLIALVGTALVFVPYQPRKTQDDVVGLGTLVEAQPIEKPVIEPLKAVEPLPTPASTATCQDFAGALGLYDWNPSLMLAIAKGESGCRWITGDNHLTFQQNGRTYGYSIGFLQVRILPGREHCEDTTLRAYMDCAYNIYASEGLSAWTVFRHGLHLQYM